MRIRKVNQITPINGEIVNESNNSQNKAYSCEYINENFTPSEVELPIDYNTVYDEDEHQIGYYAVTGGYKPLYKKLYIRQTTSNGDRAEVIDSENIIELVTRVYGSVNCPSLGYNESINKTTSNGGFINQVYLAKANNILNLKINTTTYSNNTAYWYINLEYIKTADEILTEIPKQTIPAVIQKESEVYSTTEQVIGTYLGKPLYRKVVPFTMSSGTYDLTHNLSIDSIVRVSGSIRIGTDTAKTPFPHIQVLAANSVQSCSIHTVPNKDTFRLKSQWDISDGELIIEYTKTTD